MYCKINNESSSDGQIATKTSNLTSPFIGLSRTIKPLEERLQKSENEVGVSNKEHKESFCDLEERWSFRRQRAIAELLSRGSRATPGTVGLWRLNNSVDLGCVFWGRASS